MNAPTDPPMGVSFSNCQQRFVQQQRGLVFGECIGYTGYTTCLQKGLFGTSLVGCRAGEMGTITLAVCFKVQSKEGISLNIHCSNDAGTEKVVSQQSVIRRVIAMGLAAFAHLAVKQL